MGFENKYYPLRGSYTLIPDGNPNVLTFNGVYEQFRLQNYQNCCARFLVYRISRNSDRLSSEVLYFSSDSLSYLTRQRSIEFLSSAFPDPSLTDWFAAFVLSTNTTDHSLLNPVLEFHCLTNKMHFQSSGESLKEYLISNFKYNVSVRVFGTDWSNGSDVSNPDVGYFTLSNLEGEPEHTDRQPVWDWWEIRDKNQSITFQSDGGAYLAVPEKESFDSALGIVGSSLTGLSSLLDTPLIGGLSIGSVICIPLALTLVVTLLKALNK